MEMEFKSYKLWELKKVLGSGGFGQVLLWRNSETQMEIATKSLKMNDSLGVDEERKLKERWQQEYEFSRNLKTDSIVRGIDLEDKEFLNYLNKCHAYAPLPVLITEYCNGGDLRRQLSKFENLNGLVEFQVREILRSLRNALDYMHNTCKIKHRDLKPDNIVLQRTKDGKIIYKITDFGFARYINDKTMLQSVVGTRNYLAPEIIDTAKYTNTVDYWSVGIIAFEILCGILPFIAHQSLYVIITNIKKKPDNCIAITEDVKQQNHFNCHERIFDENRVSQVFRTEIENWLRLIMNIDYRKRGIELAIGINEIPNAPGGRIIKFYTELDPILSSPILTVYSLSTNSFHEFKIKKETKITEICEQLVKETKIPYEQQYFIRPVGHPLKKLTVNAIDYFVENWQDTSKNETPPAMLFVANSDGQFNAGDPQMPEIIRNCLYNDSQLLSWITEKFARGIQFLLMNEKRHINALLCGFDYYALNIEEDILDFDDKIKELSKKANILQGRIMQFQITVDSISGNLLSPQLSSSSYQECLSSWFKSSIKHKNNIEKIQNQIVTKLTQRNHSLLRRIREQLQDSFTSEHNELDNLEIEKFRNHLEFSKHLVFKQDVLSPLCKVCKNIVFETLKRRGKFFESKKFQGMRTGIINIHQEFRKANEVLRTTIDEIDKINEHLTMDTRLFNEKLLQLSTANSENTKQRNFILASDGNENITTSMHTQTNGFGNELDGLFNYDTKDLLQEATQLMELISITPIQQTDTESNEIPATVPQN